MNLKIGFGFRSFVFVKVNVLARTNDQIEIPVIVPIKSTRCGEASPWKLANPGKRFRTELRMLLVAVVCEELQEVILVLFSLVRLDMHRHVSRHQVQGTVAVKVCSARRRTPVADIQPLSVC